MLNYATEFNRVVPIKKLIMSLLVIHFLWKWETLGVSLFNVM